MSYLNLFQFRKSIEFFHLATIISLSLIAIFVFTITLISFFSHAKVPLYSNTQIIVSFNKNSSIQDRLHAEYTVNAREVRFLGIDTAYLLEVQKGQVLDALRILKSNPVVQYAELNYLAQEAATPNDPYFPTQWAYQNTGQVVNGTTGAPGADERAVPAWDVTTGNNSIVIAEVDTGVDYTHPDLAANIWTNPGGIGGCAAGTHGYNVLNATCDPMDDDTVYGGHGTHVAGILGAVGNNGTGVSGVNWKTTILPVKWVISSGSGSTSDLITALNWILQAKQAGVNIRVVNDSDVFVGTAYSQALSDEIDLLGQNGILFVTAAGNTGDNNDDPAKRRYPCGYDRPTEICVAASDQSDNLPTWANYGPHTVDLAAPGNNIYSTLLHNTYGFINGSSMASPQVAGAAALILGVQDMSPVQLKADILNAVDQLPSLSGLLITGGRLNICRALPGCILPTPTPTPTPTLTPTPSFFDDFNRADSSNLGSNWTKRTDAGTDFQIVSNQLKLTSSDNSSSALSTYTTQGISGADYSVQADIQYPTSSQTNWLGIIGRGSVYGTADSQGYYAFANRANQKIYMYKRQNGSWTQLASYSTTISVGSTYTMTLTMSGSTLFLSWNGVQVASAVSTTFTSSGFAGLTIGNPNETGYIWDNFAIIPSSSLTPTPTSTPIPSITPTPIPTTNPTPTPTIIPSPTPTITPSAGGTFGLTTIGTNSDQMVQDRKRVTKFQLLSAGNVTKLSMYLTPTGVSGQQVMNGIIYADQSGIPGALLGVTTQLTFLSTNAANWYDMPFASSIPLQPGTYWIGVISGNSYHVAGFRWNTVAGVRAINSNTYSSGPSNPFGSATVDSEQMSVYATYISQ